MSTEVLGMKLSSPVVPCPVGSRKVFHPEGEVTVAVDLPAGRNTETATRFQRRG